MSSQKYIGKNRNPRVQIEYDVETGGANNKVSLPFVTGVVADLAGEAEVANIEERKFVEYDAENFDDRMSAMEPKTSFSVPNKMTEEEGELRVNLSFKNMNDFNPERVAEQIEPLNKMLTARKHLQNLLARVDGKADAERLVAEILSDNDLLQKIADAADKKDTDGAE